DPARLESLMQRLESASLSEIERLVRSFTLYFHIANTAEQHHRVDPEFATPAGDVTAFLAEAIEGGLSVEHLRKFYRQVHIRPVFTAHPTEVARRSVLSKLQEMDETLADWRAEPSGSALPDRHRRRMAELIEALV